MGLSTSQSLNWVAPTTPAQLSTLNSTGDISGCHSTLDPLAGASAIPNLIVPVPGAQRFHSNHWSPYRMLGTGSSRDALPPSCNTQRPALMVTSYTKEPQNGPGPHWAVTSAAQQRSEAWLQ